MWEKNNGFGQDQTSIFNLRFSVYKQSSNEGYRAGKSAVHPVNKVTILSKICIDLVHYEYFDFFFFWNLGRIKQLIELDYLNPGSIRLFILDEADKLLEEGSFQEQIK